MKLAVICGMSEDKVRARLLPLVEIDAIEEIYLVRRSPFDMEKVKTYSSLNFFNWSLFLAEIYRCLALFYVCLKEKPSYIYAIYFIPHGIYAAIIGWLLHIPVIQEFIGTDRPKVAKSKVLQKFLSKAKYIGVRGTASLEQLSSLGIPKGKIFISSAVNVLDFDLFKPDQSSKKYDLIYVGRMNENKQINILIDAVSTLCRSTPDIKLVLVGDGPERKNLENQTAKLKLNDQISFMGRQDTEDIPAFLNQSRIFIMTSAFEGLPVAMLEALSCGLPVVVPNIGDITEIAIHGYNAWLVEENDLHGYIEGISNILNNRLLYLQLCAGAYETRNKFIKTFTIAKAQNIWKVILKC